MTAKDPRSLRILEIGDRGYFYHRVPEQTTWVWSVKSRLHDEGARPEHKFTWRLAWELKRRIERGDFDVIFITYLSIPLFRPEYWLLKNLWNVLRRILFKFHSLAAYLIFFCQTRDVPIAVIDIWDDPLVRPQYFPFFPRLKRYFKRELPQNLWQVFLFTSRRSENLHNIAKQPFLIECGKKIRTFPWVCYEFGDFSAVRPEEKNMDVFYAGNNANTVRLSGLPQLEKLRAEGWRIDLPSERLPPEEFQRRLSRSWLAWSPQGFGWQCTRHYEALMYGAVPVMNYPGIFRYHPLVEGQHAFYYGCEDDDLVRVLRLALADKERLQQMVVEGRKHLRQWYSTEAVLTYVWNELTTPDAAS